MRRLRIAFAVPLLLLSASCGTAYEEREIYGCTDSLAHAACGPGRDTGGAMLGFGTIAPGEVIERVLAIQSTSDEATAIGDLASIAAPFSTDLAVDETLGPHERREITIRFAPVVAGDYRRSIELPSEDGLVWLMGSAVVPTALGCTTDTLDFGTLVPPYFRQQYLAIECTNENPYERHLRARWLEADPAFRLEGMAGHEGLLIPPGKQITIPVAVPADLPAGEIRSTLLLELQGAESVAVEVRACIADPAGEGCDPPSSD